MKNNLTKCNTFNALICRGGGLGWGCLKFLSYQKGSLKIFNPFTPEGFPIDGYNHLALDRVKSIGVSDTYGSERVTVFTRV